MTGTTATHKRHAFAIATATLLPTLCVSIKQTVLGLHLWLD